ncbi:hypothetical protein C2857_000085 [Epichloe festucae Fl1]|uniref:Uncharacterized protein n=1 Tax=Epichloe festucae (strain Fl1) TaxID=877507 RepID=A0A7S9KR38_EPIFF|nr:hypothetical protein C2857_000085 [Epichloe festucae Fl1]
MAKPAELEKEVQEALALALAIMKVTHFRPSPYPHIYVYKMSESFPLWGGAVWVHVDNTPIPLDDDARTLYTRALADPASMTDAEVRAIMLRPPADEEDELCRKECGLGFDELTAKAQRREKLSYTEGKILFRGVAWSARAEMSRPRLRLPQEDKDLTYGAVEAVTPQALRDVREDAIAATQADLGARQAALDYHHEADSMSFIYSRNIPWQEHILGSDHATVCGLAFFHPPSPAWDAFRTKVQTAVTHGMNWKSGVIKDRIRDMFTLHWVASTATGTALQEQFVALRQEPDFPPGLRRDAFLYVDDEAVASSEELRPFVWLWEPEDATLGPARVNINHIFPTLMARLTQRDLHGEQRSKPYRTGPELEMMHQAAAMSHNDQGTWDKVWPARPTLM